MRPIAGDVALVKGQRIGVGRWKFLLVIVCWLCCWCLIRGSVGHAVETVLRKLWVSHLGTESIGMGMERREGGR